MAGRGRVTDSATEVRAGARRGSSELMELPKPRKHPQICSVGALEDSLAVVDHEPGEIPPIYQDHPRRHALRIRCGFAGDRYRIDALSRNQRLNLACLMLSWAVLTSWAWAWCLQPRHWTSPVALAINVALLAVEMLFLPLWFFFWIWRMKRPNPDLSVPQLRTAMVVTKAPSEPWEMVRQTLEAMLIQEFPFPFDTWLADESPDVEARQWCAENGVRISTRDGAAAYHWPTWPRRTRCKEGNLAYFYDRWGYDLYDVVAQLDADHVPTPAYLRRMVAPFRDPLVGYVAAPSICDRNAERSWSARGRLYVEAVLHGPAQAGYSAPSCIGSHYAVRTSALHEIGGLGPELAEDFTTTLMMNSFGWHGAFAVDAEAHGDGPETVADCVTQEFQWSRSMMKILLGVGRPYRSGLSGMVKVRLWFCQLWYPLFGTLMLASVLVPIVAIMTRTPFMRVALASFYLHFGPPVLVLVATVVWLRRLDWLRPRSAKVVSWETVLFQVVRWPWVVLGCAQAVAGHMAGREFDFKVTPKGRAGATRLPMRVVLPYLLLALASATPMLLGLNAGAASGYYKLALINAGLYLGAATAILVLHIYERPRAVRLSVLRSSMSKIATTAAAALGILAGCGHPGFLIPHTHTPGPTPYALGARTALTLGVTTDALAKNSTTEWSDLTQVNGFEQTAHAHAGIVMWFADWTHAVNTGQLRAVARRHSVPEITWEPWDYRVGLRRPQPQYTLASIIQGRHDAYIRSWARSLRAYGGPVRLRFAQEMNGNWYPWGRANGNRPGQFVHAWRHVHDIFAAEHVRNVRWVWSPVARIAIPIDLTQYPGSAYVDVIGLSGFNGGTVAFGIGWRTFASLFDPALSTLHRFVPSKPIEISEVGSAERGGNKAAWITRMFDDLRRHPQVKSIVWFNLRKQTDWRITSSRRAAVAFATGITTR